MRRALKPRLAAYKIPQEMRVLETLPKNAMGKGEFCFLFFVFLLLMFLGSGGDEGRGRKEGKWIRIK